MNSPSDGSIQLYDANYGGKFSDVLLVWRVGLSVLLSQLMRGLLCLLERAYQMRVQVHYGSGLNQVVDGVAHVYLDGWCLWDFADVRFGTARRLIRLRRDCGHENRR